MNLRGLGIEQSGLNEIDTEKYASERASTIGEALGVSFKEGWYKTKAFSDTFGLNMAYVLEDMGFNPNGEAVLEVHNRLQQSRAMIDYLDKRNQEYLNTGGVLNKITKNLAVGTAGFVTDIPQVLLNATVGTYTRGANLITKIGAETAVNTGYDYFQKEKVLGKEFTKGDLAVSLGSNLLFTSAVEVGLPFISNKVRGILETNNIDVKKTARNFITGTKNKILETGIPFEKTDVDDMLRFNGYTVNEVKAMQDVKAKFDRLEQLKNTTGKGKKARSREINTLKEELNGYDLDEINYTLEEFNKKNYSISDETINKMAQKEFNVSDTVKKIDNEVEENIKEMSETLAKDKFNIRGVQEEKIKSSIKTLNQSLKDNNVSLSEKEIQNLLLDNIYTPFKSTETKIYSGLRNSLKNTSYNSKLDFANTITEFNKKTSFFDYITKGGKIEVPDEILLPVNKFKNFLDENINILKEFTNEDISKEVLMAKAYYNRANFFDSIKGDIRLKKNYKGNYNYGSLTSEDIKNLKNNFVSKYSSFFNGKTVKQQKFYARNFIENFMPEFLSGKAGTGNKFRATSIHRYAPFMKTRNLEQITDENLLKLFKNTSKLNDVIMVDNLIDDLSHSLALTKHFGKDMQNFVTTTDQFESLFKEGFKDIAEASKSYHNPVQAFREIIKDEMGLTIKGQEEEILSTIGKVLYAPYKPLSALFQFGEKVVATMDTYKHFNFKNKTLIGATFEKYKKMPYSDRKKFQLVSKWFNALEKQHEISKMKIDTTDMSNFSKMLYYANQTINKVDNITSKMSLYEQQQNIFNISKSMNAVYYTREIFDSNYDDLTKKVALKNIFDRIGLNKKEFELLQRNIGEVFEISPRDLEINLRDIDLKTIFPEYEKLSNDNIASLLAGKIETLQDIIMTKGDVTKPNPFTVVRGTDFQSRLLSYATTFLKKSGLASTTRAYNILINSSRRHNAGMPIKEEFVKNIFSSFEGVVYVALANKVSNVLKRVLTTDTPIDKIIDEEFTFEEASDIEKFVLSNAIQGFYLNSGLNPSLMQSLADNIERGRFEGLASFFTPRFLKPVKRFTDDD